MPGGHYIPTNSITLVAAECRVRYLDMSTELLTMLRESFVEVCITPGESETTYWLFRENVASIDQILLTR